MFTEKSLRGMVLLGCVLLAVLLIGCKPETLPARAPQTGALISPISPPATSTNEPTPPSNDWPTLTPWPTLPPEPTRSGTPVIKHGPTPLPTPTRPPLLLTPIPVGLPPSDLQALYYVADNNGTPELRVIGIDSQGRKWFESNIPNLPPSQGYALHVSPDGQYLAIDLAYDGLRVLELSSGKIWCVLENKRGECDGNFGDWMPDNHLLLRPGGGWPPETDIVPGGALIVDIHTGKYEQLDLPIQPQWGYSLVQQISLSPDGTKLAYSIIYPEDQKEISEIWIMQLDTKAKQLVRKIEAVINALAWSPTDDHLLYMCQPGTRPAQSDPAELWLLNSDGTKARLLVSNLRNPGDWIFEPAWSPDGRRVAFVQVDDIDLFLSDPRGPGSNAYVIDTITEQSTKLSAFKDRRNDSPTWSPDGKFVAFVSSIFSIDPYGGIPRYMEVWVASADGKQLYALSGAARSPGRLAWSQIMPTTQEK